MPLARQSFTIPQDILLWLKAYAASRGVSVSRAMTDLVTEKKAELKAEARERSPIQKILRGSQSERK